MAAEEPAAASEMRFGRRPNLAVPVVLLAAAAALLPGPGRAAGAEDPYRYLDPPPGQLGEPSPVSMDIVVQDGSIPALDAGTGEAPPQAQVRASRGTFTAPAGATQFTLTIEAIEPPAPASDGSHLVGNVYRFLLAAADGSVPKTAPQKKATVILRGIPADVPTALNRFDGTAWRPLHSLSAGGTRRSATVRLLGDFALIAAGPAPSVSASALPSVGAEPTPRPTATPRPTPAPVPSPSPASEATAAPRPSPTQAPLTLPPGSQPDQTPVVAAVAVGAAFIAGTLVFLVWRRRRGSKQDWRTYR